VRWATFTDSAARWRRIAVCADWIRPARPDAAGSPSKSGRASHVVRAWYRRHTQRRGGTNGFDPLLPFADDN